MRKYRYTVEVTKMTVGFSETIEWHEGLSEKEATVLAREKAEEYRSCVVLVHWHSFSGDHGYLSPDGKHELTGVAW